MSRSSARGQRSEHGVQRRFRRGLVISEATARQPADDMPVLSVKLRDVVHDAQASTIALSTFRKHVRVELPFPLTAKQSAYDIARAVHALSCYYCEGLAEHFGADRVYVLYTNASVRNCIDRDNEEIKSRELRKVRKS